MHRVALPFRRRLAVAVAVLTLAFAGCSDPTGPLPRNGPSQALEFTQGGWGTPSTTVLLMGDSVLFVRRRPTGGGATDSVSVVPSAEQWRAFWAAARAAGVTRWKDEYASDVLDGVGWSLHIGLDGSDVRSSGSNAWPDRFGAEHHGPTPDFDAFVAAAGALVGRDISPYPPEL